MDYENIIVAILRLVFFAAAMISLLLSSISAQQFEDSIEWRSVVVAVLTVSLGVFLFMPWICQNISEKLLRVHFSVRALVNMLVFAFASLLFFLIKYPRFNIHSNYNTCLITTGSGSQNPAKGYLQMNMYTFGALSFVAVQLGIFNFLLELTMDASMGIPVWYMLASAVYCSTLIFVKSNYLESSKEDGCNRLSNADNGNDRSSITSSNSHVQEVEEEGHVTTCTYQGTTSRGGVLRRRRSDKTSKSTDNSHQLLMLEWSMNKCLG